VKRILSFSVIFYPISVLIRALNFEADARQRS
jgi:hypothetical protein